LDTTWALSELNNFRTLTELEPPPDRPNVVNLSPCLFIRGNLADIVASAHVVEQIFDRIIPNWRSEVPDDRNDKINRWCQHIEAAQRVRTVLQRQEEVQEKLGDNAPRLNAAHTCTPGSGKAPGRPGKAVKFDLAGAPSAGTTPTASRNCSSAAASSRRCRRRCQCRGNGARLRITRWITDVTRQEPKGVASRARMR
jgi:hypothetical protein